MKIITGIIKREKREKIEKILQRLRYRVYQANIALQSHDGERLLDLAKRIRINGRKIDKVLQGKEKVRKAKVDGRGRKKRKIRNKKTSCQV